MSHGENKTTLLFDEIERVDVDAVMAEYDRESNTRHYKGVPGGNCTLHSGSFFRYMFFI